MPHIFDSKLAVILNDVQLSPSGGANRNNYVNLKAGDTAMVINWEASQEFTSEHKWNDTTARRGMYAKIMPACSAESGRMCYIEKPYIQVIKDDYVKRLAGKGFCITGTLEFPREVFVSVLQMCGGVYKTAMSGNVDYLISARSDTVKAQKARELHITVINEKEFYTKILGCGSFGREK